MTTPAGDRLYALLPAAHRQRDAALGQPLRALLAVMGRELGRLEDDVDALYDNWFIETCDEWVVPYIGDLLGVRGLPEVSGGVFSQRARVAGTIAARRRKGTAAMLEQLARDVTGWPAHAVEMFERLVTTQHLNHVRLDSPATLSLRDATALELVPGPLERAQHTVEVRHIDNGRGKYNLPNVGIFLWRLQDYPIVRGGTQLLRLDGGRTFDPFGLDLPLFNPPVTEDAIDHLATEIDLPLPLRRRVLSAELAARRASLLAEETPRAAYFGVAPVLSVFLDGDDEPLRPEELMICDLGDWHRPIATPMTLPNGDIVTPRVAVDPMLGRLAIPDGDPLPDGVEVSYAYGFSGDLGGGPYDRRASVAAWLDGVRADAGVGTEVGWQLCVTRRPTPGDTEAVTTLAEAVQQWNQQPNGTVGVIAILDSLSYVADLNGASTIGVPEDSHLLIVAAEWPTPAVLGSARAWSALLPVNRRPHLLGNIDVVGTAPADSRTPGSLALDGLLIEGTVTVRAGQLGALGVAHGTLPPRSLAGTRGTLVVESATGAPNDRLAVTVERCICGGITVADTSRSLRVVESIVDRPGTDALVGPATTVNGSTVLGRTRVRSLDASDSLFVEAVAVERRQIGCVRFSYLRPGSPAPRRYRCQPPDTVAGRAIRPQFTSVRYGDPAYAQLAASCSSLITTGASDEGEMGAFNFLRSAQRVGNLRASLDEYLRVGLEAGLFFAT